VIRTHYFKKTLFRDDILLANASHLSYSTETVYRVK